MSGLSFSSIQKALMRPQLKLKLILATLGTAVTLLSAMPSFAVDAKTDAAKPMTPSAMPTKKAKTGATIKTTDINGATREELKKLPGIGEAEADKIIAGRPYGSKAHLVTRNIISAEIYQGLRQQVIAKQATQDAAKNAALVKKQK